jgi:hypothetical protein
MLQGDHHPLPLRPLAMQEKQTKALKSSKNKKPGSKLGAARWESRGKGTAMMGKGFTET